MANKTLDETELKAIIAQELSSAESFATEELSPSRQLALDYYQGRLTDVKSVPGRSQYVSRDVSNVVGWVLPDLLRVFTASDRILDCLPETEADEGAAEQAADYLNYCFWRDNDGYQIMWDATWDALVNKDGIIKQFWDVREEHKVSVYTGMTQEEIDILMSEDTSRDKDIATSNYVKMEIIDQSKPYIEGVPVEIEVPEQPEMGDAVQLVDVQSAEMGGEDQTAAQMGAMGGQEPTEQAEQPEQPQGMLEPAVETMMVMQDVELFDIRVRRTTRIGRMRYQTVAPENFGTDPGAIDLRDNWRFQFERAVDVTRSDLIKMGFSQARVEDIPAFQQDLSSDEDNARRGWIAGRSENQTKETERVSLYECYLKVDINGDGIAETVKVMYAGDSGSGSILDWEEYDDDTPYDKIPCNPVPHRFWSDSLADDVIDLQKFKTVLGRQMFDNLYQVNMPQPTIEKGSIENMDVLVNRQLGAPIIRKVGSGPIQWDVTPFIGDKVLAALQYLDSAIEMRTGVSRGAMALDPDTLNNQTATAAQIAKDTSRSQVELIARNQAEMGWKKVFQKSLRIVVKNQDRPRTIKLRDEWVDMDPRHWNVGMDIVINVGLGTGSRDRDMAMLQNIAITQQEDMNQLQALGFSDQAIDMMPKLVKTQIKIAEAAGIKSPEGYYPQIDEDAVEAMKQQVASMQGQPDPKQAQAQAEFEAEMQMKQAEMQMKQQAQDAELQMKQDQMQMDFQLKQQEIQANAALRREQMQMEFQLRQEQVAAELNMKQNLAMVGVNASSGGGAVHLGGEPG